VGAGAGACAAAAAGMKMATTRAATATTPSGALIPAIPHRGVPPAVAGAGRGESGMDGRTDGTATTKPRAPAPTTNARASLSLSSLSRPDLLLSPRASKKA